MNPIEKNVQYLYFYIFGEIFEQFVDKFSKNFEEFVQSREWTIAPPKLFLKDDDDDDNFIIGGEFKTQILWTKDVKREAEINSYSDIKNIIEFLTEYSYRYSAEIEFELDGENIGSISSGDPCELISIALLEEWEKQLGLR